MDAIEVQIKKIDADIQKIWDDFHAKSDEYWQQKHKLDFLEWQHKVQKRKIEQIEREKRKAAYEQREKEKEKEEAMKKYLKEVETCNVLINYLLELQKGSSNQAKEETQEHEQVNIAEKLNSAAEWKKEKGLEVLQSKKSKEDESPVKKGKKHNKKKNADKAEEKKKF